MWIKNQKILILSPHTDDGELGCGGSVVRLIENKNKIFYAAFSSCQESVPAGYPKNILIKEMKKATNTLGIKEKNTFLFDYPVRNFPEHRQNILEDLIRLGKNISPDIVFCPSSYDVHQDHSTIFQEARRAFKKTTILGYEFMWNNYAFNGSVFIALEKAHILKKVDAVSKYKSQSVKSYMKEDFLVGHALFRGIQVGAKYAETFESIRIVI